VGVRRAGDGRDLHHLAWPLLATSAASALSVIIFG
jgi:hypothetical protein